MVNRGDIYMADLGPEVGYEQATQRPVLIVSAQSWLNSNLPVLTVLPITRTQRNSPDHIEIEPGTSGLQATSYAKAEDIRAISPQRLTHHFGTADTLILLKAQQALRRFLDI